MKRLTREEVAAKWLKYAAVNCPVFQPWNRYEFLELADLMLRELDATSPKGKPVKREDRLAVEENQNG